MDAFPKGKKKKRKEDTCVCVCICIDIYRDSLIIKPYLYLPFLLPSCIRGAPAKSPTVITALLLSIYISEMEYLAFLSIVEQGQAL